MRAINIAIWSAILIFGCVAGVLAGTVAKEVRSAHEERKQAEGCRVIEEIGIRSMLVEKQKNYHASRETIDACKSVGIELIYAKEIPSVSR
jgi:hypothetical protein